MELWFTSPDGPKGSEGDPDYIFLTLNTCKATFISDIFWYDYRNWNNMEVWRTYVWTYGQTDETTDRREVWNSYLDGYICLWVCSTLDWKSLSYRIHFVIWVFELKTIQSFVFNFSSLFTLHLKKQYLSMNSLREFDSVLYNIDHY